MLESKVIQVSGKTFVIHKLPATVAVEVMARSAANALPSVGDFSNIEAMMIKTMSYASIRRQGLDDLPMNSREMIDNHCVDYQTYLKVLEEVRAYSQLFGVAGNILSFLGNAMEKLPAKIVKILMDALPPSSTPNLQPSTNSEPSTV